MKIQTETIYRCDICGKESVWVKGTWIAHTFFFGIGYKGWEHEYHLCSWQCDTKLELMSKQQRKRLIFK